MRKSPNNKAVFFTDAKGRTVPVNRAARREVDARARKSRDVHTRRSRATRDERESREEVQLRRARALEFRETRRSRLYHLMGDSPP